MLFRKHLCREGRHNAAPPRQTRENRDGSARRAFHNCVGCGAAGRRHPGARRARARAGRHGRPHVPHHARPRAGTLVRQVKLPSTSYRVASLDARRIDHPRVHELAKRERPHARRRHPPLPADPRNVGRRPSTGRARVQIPDCHHAPRERDALVLELREGVPQRIHVHRGPHAPDGGGVERGVALRVRAYRLRDLLAVPLFGIRSGRPWLGRYACAGRSLGSPGRGGIG